MYTLHKSALKIFLRNPYTVNNVGDLCLLDLVVMSFLSSQNGGYKYILNAIYVFYKYAHSVLTRSKTGETVATAFRSILYKADGRKPLALRTDNGKEIVNTRFRKLLNY